MEEKIFIIVHDWVIQRLKTSEAMCYELIRSLCKDGSKYSGGAKYIAQRLGMTENAVNCILTKLRAMNVLEHEYITNGRGRYSAYWPNDENLAKTSPKILVTPTQETCEPIPKKLGDPSPKILVTPTQETCDNNKYNNKDNKENNKEYKHITPSDEGVTFEQFWDAYGVKKSKKDAERAWKKLSKADKDAAMKAIPAYQQDCVRCDRQRQYAATYLNKRTFEDDFSFNDNNHNNNGRDSIRRGVWPTPAENATRAEEWATNRILELTQPKDKGIQGEISDNRDTDKLFLPF